MCPSVATALNRVYHALGITWERMGEYAECDGQTVSRAAQDMQDLGASKFVRLARKLLARHGDATLVRCCLAPGWDVVPSGGTANGTMDDDYADLCLHVTRAREHFKARDKGAARVALALAQAEMNDLAAEIAALPD